MSEVTTQTNDQSRNPANIPTWEYKGITYPLYPVDTLQSSVTEVTDPETEKVLGFLTHYWDWETDAPFNEHQKSLVMSEEKLPGNAGTREAAVDIAGKDSELYEKIIVSGEYTENNKDRTTTTLSRVEMLDMCDREDRSRAIREFFDVTVKKISPGYSSGLDLLRNKQGLLKYAILIGNPLQPIAVMVVTMEKSDAQARENYESTVRSAVDRRKGQLPVTETTYNLQAQTNFARKYFVSAEGAAFKQGKFSLEGIEPDGVNAYVKEFLDQICPKWLALLGDAHYSSAAKTQGKS